LAECEREFSDRYTDKDKEFVQFKAVNKVEPPCVHPWRGGHQHQGGGGGGHRGGGGGGDRGRRDGGGGDHYRDRERDRGDRDREEVEQ
jgi:hypothetical protein